MVDGEWLIINGEWLIVDDVINVKTGLTSLIGIASYQSISPTLLVSSLKTN